MPLGTARLALALLALPLGPRVPSPGVSWTVARDGIERIEFAMAERGVFMVPVALKRNHVSAAHTDADIDHTLELAREVLRELPAA